MYNAFPFIHIFMLGYIVTGFLPFCKYFIVLLKTNVEKHLALETKRIRHIGIGDMPEKEDRI